MKAEKRDVTKVIGTVVTVSMTREQAELLLRISSYPVSIENGLLHVNGQDNTHKGLTMVGVLSELNSALRGVLGE